MIYIWCWKNSTHTNFFVGYKDPRECDIDTDPEDYATQVRTYHNESKMNTMRNVLAAGVGHQNVCLIGSI